MIFDRGNNLIKSVFKVNNTILENVKTTKYLRFTIHTKNCSFVPTLDDLSIKAKRTIYSLNNKTKISKFPLKLALKLFESLIKPILLYGAEVWGPYCNFDYIKWEPSKIEMTHTQFLKRALGCNFQTSNIMTRGEVGARPLLLDVKMKAINYIKSIFDRPSDIPYAALAFEMNNNNTPNFFRYINVNDTNISTENKKRLKTILYDDYDKYWRSIIIESSKALAYKKIKQNVSTENYLFAVKNMRHKTALSRLRLSNHKLYIETGRHLRPKLERSKRKCFICKNEIEDEIHFVVNCPLYSTERNKLFHAIRYTSKHFDQLKTDEQKFIFIMTNEDTNVMKQLAKYTYNAMQIREKVINIDNASKCFQSYVLIEPLRNVQDKS